MYCIKCEREFYYNFDLFHTKAKCPNCGEEDQILTFSLHYPRLYTSPTPGILPFKGLPLYITTVSGKEISLRNVDFIIKVKFTTKKDIAFRDKNKRISDPKIRDKRFDSYVKKNMQRIFDENKVTVIHRQDKIN